ncbi:MAG TPA: hypothetical protein VIP28_13225 [Nocardioides sp.]
MSAPTTAGDGQGAGGAAATASPADPHVWRRLCFHGHAPDRCHWCKAGPTPETPFTAEEWDAIQSTIWSDLENDPYRFDQLLSMALGTLAGIALDGQTAAAGLCVRTLRELEQRALWGPDHEQEDHR